MSTRRTDAIRDALLDIISKKTEVHLTYLQERCDSRKSIHGSVNFTDVLTELAHLERRKLISYIGHDVYRISEKGLVHAGRSEEVSTDEK